MENLHELRQAQQAIAPLEARLLTLNRQFFDAQLEVAALLRRLGEESRDVENIKKQSFSSFVLKTLGRYDNRLEKELCEELEAKQNYDRARVNLDELERERSELTARLAELREASRGYAAELERRRRAVRELASTDFASEYFEREKQIADAAAQVVEIKEALAVASRIQHTAQYARESLASADKWSTYDIWTRGGILTHAAKYSHIDSAEEQFNLLSSQLRMLKSELRDVGEFTAPYLSGISSAERAVDFWFDNIFTNISVRKQVRDNINQLDYLTSRVNNLQLQLNGKLRDITLTLDRLSDENEQFLLSMPQK